MKSAKVVILLPCWAFSDALVVLCGWFCSLPLQFLMGLDVEVKCDPGSSAALHLSSLFVHVLSSQSLTWAK